MNPKKQKAREAALGANLDKEAAELLRIMQDLESRGQQVIIQGVSGEITDAKKKAMLQQIKEAAAEADTKLKEWLAPAIAASYISGFNYADDLIKTFSIKVGTDKLTIEILRGVEDFTPHLQAVNALISDAYLDFGSGITGWVKGNERIINDVTRRQIQAKISQGRLTGQAVDTIRKEVKEQLAAQGLRSLIDRGGREWTLDRYSEMLTRTHLIKANNEATLLRGAEYEIDIYQVSVHGATDELCAPYEKDGGLKFSVSGKSKNYPKLTPRDTPPYHPNCKHSLLPRPDLS